MPINISDDKRRDYLRDEYLFLQGQYEDYDKRSLTIKGWVSTGAAGALALSFSGGYTGKAVVPIMTAVIVLSVWYLEASWKLFQYALSDRIRVIEAYFRGDPDIHEKTPAPFQIYHAWFRSFANDQPIYEYEERFRPRSRLLRWIDAARQPFVCLPYLLIVALCAVSAIVLGLRA